MNINGSLLALLVTSTWSTDTSCKKTFEGTETVLFKTPKTDANRSRENYYGSNGVCFQTKKIELTIKQPHQRGFVTSEQNESEGYGFVSDS